MDLKTNIALLLLQVTFYRQQELCHLDKTLDSEHLLVDPIIDENVLTKFKDHKLVKLYASELAGIRIRTLKNLVRELFEKGLPDKQSPVTVLTLANFYYSERIKELESKEIPELRNEILQGLHDHHVLDQ